MDPAIDSADRAHVHVRSTGEQRIRAPLREGARLVHQLEEAVARGERGGGAREVLVRGAVPGEEPAESGHHLPAVDAEERAEGAARLAELQHHYTAARAHDP